MEKSSTLSALDAPLVQNIRLDLFRLLVQAGPQGLPAGEVGERLGLPGDTLSFHLNTLEHAGLIRCRSLIYGRAAGVDHPGLQVGSGAVLWRRQRGRRAPGAGGLLPVRAPGVGTGLRKAA